MRIKKGALAFDFIYGLTFLFGLALLYIIFNQVATIDFQPTIEGTIPDSAPEKADIIINNNEWMAYWDKVPFLLLFSVLLFWFVRAASKGRNEL